MKTADYIIIFKNVEYKVNAEKLQYVFSLLENKNVKIENEKQVRELLQKYKLYDENFLKNINSI